MGGGIIPTVVLITTSVLLSSRVFEEVAYVLCHRKLARDNPPL